MKIHSDIVMTDGHAPWDDKWESIAYKVTLRYDGRQMTVPFYTGSAYGNLTTRAVVECLASDLFLVDPAYCRGFEDFCGELGYDTDSRKAEKTYKDSLRQSAAFRRLLGPDLLRQLTDSGDSELFAKRYSAEED